MESKRKENKKVYFYIKFDSRGSAYHSIYFDTREKALEDRSWIIDARLLTCTPVMEGYIRKEELYNNK